MFPISFLPFIRATGKVPGHPRYTFWVLEFYYPVIVTIVQSDCDEWRVLLNTDDLRLDDGTLQEMIDALQTIREEFLG